MRYLLDTNVCIEFLLRKGSPAVKRRVAATPKADIGLPSTVVFELRAGAFRRNDPIREVARVDAFVDDFKVLPADRVVVERAAAIEGSLRSQGTPIGAFDALIAGHAVVAGLTLVTHNTREFSRVAGLAFEDWQV